MQETETDCNGEEWRPVVGYEGIYEVSNLARVKRIAGGKGSNKGGIRRPVKTQYGYLEVILYPRGLGSNCLHLIVAASFLGPCPTGLECNHKDGNKTNSLPGNLEYITHADNLRHAKENGLIARGSRRKDAKLNECLVRLIKCSLRYESAYRTSKMFGLPTSTVTNIYLGTCWDHVKMRLS